MCMKYQLDLQQGKYVKQKIEENYFKILYLIKCQYLECEESFYNSIRTIRDK